MYATPPAVDFEDAETLLTPDGTGEGHWVGAPTVYRHDGTTYLAVRYRDPERRGYAVELFAYDDGDLTSVLEITAAEVGVVSIERVGLVTHPRTGAVQCYLPVDRGGNDWTIRKCADAPDVASIDPTTARPVVRPRPGHADAGVVKDPYLVTVGGRYYMFYAGADGLSEQACLATSVDGETWTRRDEPVLGRGYWHDHHTRVSTVVPAPEAPAWLVFYDGSGVADEGRTWNLRTGVAVSPDLESVTDTSPDGPLYSAPTADRATGLSSFGTCRYLDVLRHDDEWELFAEVARPDGSFDLRRARTPAPGTDAGR
jgi:hypothetical protein